MKKTEKIKEVYEAEKLVPDTSVIIEGLVSKYIQKKQLKVGIVLFHEAVLRELEHQANLNKAIGFLGLEEIEKIKKLSTKSKFEVEFGGRKPTAVEVKYAKRGEIDALIRDLAYEEDGTLFTADKVQATVANAKGVKNIFIKIEQVVGTLKLEKFFDKTTMSVHLRENVLPYAKKGMPGNWSFEAVGKKPLERDDIQDVSREIIEEASIRKDGFIEIERPGSTIVQLGLYRIVITKPPFSDGWEITAVRPVKKLSLIDYSLSEKLNERVCVQAEGILIAGAPGMGKSTFAQALAEFYAGQDKIVKTVEAPRDLVLPENVTQYAMSHGNPQEIHDILLLSRPDYTLFDEMRNTRDFKLFADLRLSGVGMVGVVHATNPIDAIQRFVGRIELGVIPQIIDTVIFIKNGIVNKVLNLNMVVKVPSGMTESDLARPVVVINDFETQKAEYELYSYGEETVVVPVKGDKQSPSHELAARSIEQEFRKHSNNVKAEMAGNHKCIIYVPKRDVAKLIGKQGKNIERFEKKLGISIDVREMNEKNIKNNKDNNNNDNDVREEIEFTTKVSKNGVMFYFSGKMMGKDVDIYIGDEILMTAKVGHGGNLKFHKRNKIGRKLLDALDFGKKIKVLS